MAEQLYNNDIKKVAFKKNKFDFEFIKFAKNK